MTCGSSSNHPLQPRAFTLLETLLMLVALVVFTLLTAGMTKAFWSPGAQGPVSIPSIPLQKAPVAR